MSELATDWEQEPSEEPELNKITPSQAPFPVECLPEVAQHVVEGITRILPMPVAIPASCALGVLSAAIGPGLRVRSMPDGSTTGSNLYILVGADSSSTSGRK
jgi:hypothetical protein